jgi:hypothetical protein
MPVVQDAAHSPPDTVRLTETRHSFTLGASRRLIPAIARAVAAKAAADERQRRIDWKRIEQPPHFVSSSILSPGPNRHRNNFVSAMRIPQRGLGVLKHQWWEAWDGRVSGIYSRTRRAFHRI